jgi:hypothetical protein
MLRAGYYAVYKDLVLTSGGRRARVSKRDWLVTDELNIGRFDKTNVMDWLPLEWGNGQPVTLDEELSQQLHNASVLTTFSRLEAAFMKLLDLGDGSPVPEMPRPSIWEGLGGYLRARRTLTGSELTYRRR